MGARCGKKAPDGGLKEREAPRLEDGANSRGCHSSFSMGAQPTRMAGQSYRRLSIDGPEHATAGHHFLKQQSTGTLETPPGPKGPREPFHFLDARSGPSHRPVRGFMAPCLGDLRGARAFPLISSHLARHLSRRFLARLGALLRPGHFCSWAAKKTHGPATANDIEQAGQAAVEIAAEIMKEAQQLANGTTG